MQNENDFCVIYDWFSFTVKGKTLDEVIELSNLSGVSFIETHGHYGYKRAKFFNGIWILYEGSDGTESPFAEDMGICVEMSGQGCREYETLDNCNLDTLVNFIAVSQSYDSEHFNITRLDVAFDDIDKEGSGLLDIDLIDNIARSDEGGVFVTKFRQCGGSWKRNLSETKEKGFEHPAKTVYFGSEKSEVRFRIYDKAQERGGLDYHWVRFEMQLRHERAYNFLTSELVLGARFCGVINNYLRFVEPLATDSNKWRWNNAEWWNNFLCTLEKITIFTKKDIDYNLGRVENYISYSAGNSIEVLLQCVGLSAFMDLIRKRESKLNQKQEALVAEYKQLQRRRLDELYKKNPHFINF